MYATFPLTGRLARAVPVTAKARAAILAAATTVSAGSGPGRARRRRGWAAQVACAAAGVLAASCLAIPAASADPGGLVFYGCIGDLAGCTPTYPHTALDSPHGVITYGSQVYAASGSNAVTHFTTDAAGDLIFDGCIGDLAGCTPVSPADAMEGPAGLAAVNGQLYVTAAASETVSHFTIDRAGNLAFDGCIGQTPGCTAVPAGVLDGAGGAAATPDGRQLYVSSSDNVSHFTIDRAGNLAFDGCIGGTSGCTPTSPADALRSAYVSGRGVAVTPDGGHLYVSAGTSYQEGAVSHFLIDAAGNLAFDGCIGELAGCTPTSPADALGGPTTLVVTPYPNGPHLYVAAGDEVSHLTIDAAGNLAFDGCIGLTPGCTQINPPDALLFTDGLAVTSQGPASLYADSYTLGLGGAITHFIIDPAGNLIFDGCIGRIPGCTPISPATALDGAGALALNTTRESLYATGNHSNAVSHFITALF